MCLYYYVGLLLSRQQQSTPILTQQIVPPRQLSKDDSDSGRDFIQISKTTTI